MIFVNIQRTALSQRTPQKGCFQLYKIYRNWQLHVKNGENCEVYSKSTIKASEQWPWSTKVFSVNFDYISTFALISIFYLDYDIEWLDWATQATA